MASINEYISSIEKSFEKGDFDKFIHEINFPKFKNFAPGISIKFKFPVTIIVGPNGGGKSSILQAVWGMPLDHSTSRFWFSTPVDPIEYKVENQTRYWYSHYVKNLNQLVQCRKMIGNKRHGYWEPTRPAKKDGMLEMPPKTKTNELFMSGSGDRWNQVPRKPYYINSKAESSAFDRFFYYTKQASLEYKQDYFVKYSGLLKAVIDEHKSSFIYYGVERVAKNFSISIDLLNIINNILQKKYKSARYIIHSLYDKNTSPSIIFETDARSYSECFAGSGELAVVNYVLALQDLVDFDLLLLDEPETSLHPGAQTKLIQYILSIVESKKVQVIISTHSTTFVDLLPTDALIVLDETLEGIVVRPESSKATAFYRLGHIVKNKITILTEDLLLKALVEKAVRKIPVDVRKYIVVESAEVGASEMLSNQVRAYIQNNANVIMVLDGDQSSVANIFRNDPDSLSNVEKSKAIQELKALKVSIVGTESKFEDWMRWCNERIVIIEQVCPEQVLLELINSTHPLLLDKNATNKNYKDAVRKVLNNKGNDVDAMAQKNILTFKLNELNEDSSIDKSVGRLADALNAKVKKLIK